MYYPYVFFSYSRRPVWERDYTISVCVEGDHIDILHCQTPAMFFQVVLSCIVPVMHNLNNS